MMERQKIKIMTTKYPKARERISLYSEEEKNYENNTENKTNLDQANDKYLLQP